MKGQLEMWSNMTNRRGFAVLFLALSLAVFTSRGWSNELRTSMMGNCSIALYDEDNQINPYDFGHNPAYLLNDFELEWMRFVFGLEEESGKLKRPYDPLLVNNLYIGFNGIRKLGDRHVTKGSFTYTRLWQREISNSLEIDQYNDPFYLADETTGDFEYYGPSTQVDYSLRLKPNLYIGLGFDYDISTGLKQNYTKPEIVHTYFKGNIGLIYEARKSWLIGLVARPVRLQNRTKFRRTDEGFDNVIYRWYGDGIYDIRAVSDYTVRELLYGVEVGLQNFIMTDRFKLGAIMSYSLNQNKLRYHATKRVLQGFWQSTVYDLDLRARYTPPGIPLVIGISGRFMNDDGWAKRPDFNDVLLYENPVELISVGGGLSYLIDAADLLVSAEYLMNMYDVEA
ncbi:MAG: hypothetical protein KAX13_01915, partial [Candidatus Krumholzibacteria bacterium]|nr:hypothetical protein [Candidatus Krumholzibacteria bacterium]